MHLNKLSEVQKVNLTKFKLSAVGQEYASSDEEAEGEEKKEDSKQNITAFDIDSKAQDGRVVLMYNRTHNKPQIWFQDLSCCWFFIANTFTDYFRLMIMHLGLPHWQYVFTNVGMDPQSLQWFRYMLPDRLTIDLENRTKKLSEDEGARKKAAKDETNVKGIKRKKRRMKSKTKGATSHNFEKFSTHSNKTVKFARYVVSPKRLASKKTKPPKPAKTGAPAPAAGTAASATKSAAPAPELKKTEDKKPSQ